MSGSWNGNTHGLGVQIGQSKVSIELPADGIALRTDWNSKVVETKSVLDEQVIELEW